MNEARIAQYLDLIQRLLSCSGGEQWAILQGQREFWDEESLRTLQREAGQLRGMGRENEAGLLEILAGQLVEVLGTGEESNSDTPKDYLSFLMQLLQTVNDSQGNPQQVYSFLRQNLDKLDLQLIEVLTTWATNTFAQAEVNQATDIAIDIINLANLINQFPLGNRLVNLEIGITCYKIVSTVFNRKAFPKQWAKTQNNLAVAYSFRINGSRAENLERAIEYYQAALTVRTREDFPEDWAGTQNNLALTYIDRIQGSRAENLEQAIKYFQAALIVRTCEDFPEDWATTQNNLGEAYRNRINGSRAENLEQAIKYYQAALTVRTCEDFPEQWATTQNNLAIAYSDRIQGSRAENLERAIEYYQAALTVSTREDFLENWAATQNNLGEAYRNRIQGSQAENLERAIEYYQAALSVRTREDFPEDWAGTQNNLANAYSDRIQGSQAENLEQAIEYYQAALSVRTREDFPEQWAETQNNLAIAYSFRINGSRVENWERAIEYYQAASTVYTLEDFPEKWATTQNNLANAYNNRIKGSRAENVEYAIELYKNALTIRNREAFPQDHIKTLCNLGDLYRINQKWKLAYNTYKPAIETVDFLRGEIQSGDETKQKLAEEWNRLYLGMVEVCIELAATEPIYYTKAIEYAERSKARNLVELLATRDLYPKGDIPATVLDQLSRLRREIDAEQRRLDNQRATRHSDLNTGERSLTLTTSPAGIDRAHLNQLQQQLSNLITHEISSIDPEFALTQAVTPIPYAEIQTLTGTNTAILEWYILNDKFLTFIITPDPPLTPPTLREAKPTKGGRQEQTPLSKRGEQEQELDSKPPFSRGAGGIQLHQSTPQDQEQLVNWTNEYLRDYYNDREAWQNSLTTKLANLAQILHIDDILQTLPKETTELILIPHRYLHLFPLHALPVRPETWQHFHPEANKDQNLPSPSGRGAEGKFLLDCFDAGTHYAPSCQILHQVQKYPRGKFENFFGIQTPTPDLYAKGETDLGAFGAIKQQFTNPSTILKKNQATKANLLPLDPHTQKITQHPDLTQADSTLFFCHGIFDIVTPLNSRLQLADGDLTLGEIIEHLDLRNCHFVTLAACETGLVDFQSNTDEYIGLPNGFLLAGSTNVISTLWSVRSDATALFMIKFHEQLKKQPNLSLTLKQTQQWLRDSTIQDLRAWLATSQINDVMKRKINKYFQQEQQKPDNTQGENTKIYTSPYFWAAFCVIGRGN